jgi:hypothetical protein
VRGTHDYELQGPYNVSDYRSPEIERAIGRVAFAAVMLGLAGIWNVIGGILAVSSSRVYADSSTFVFSGLNTWGWIVIILGIIECLAALAIVSGSEFARWFGITAAGLNAIGQLMFVPVYPWWAISMFAVDVLIIYALAVYGGHRLREAG